MPTWSLDSDAGTLVVPTSQNFVPPITGVKPVGEVFNKDASDDLNELLRRARESKKSSGQAGMVVPTDESAASFTVIAEARKLMDAGEYLAALRLIAPLIRTMPNDSQLTRVRVDLREAMIPDVLDDIDQRQNQKDFGGALAVLNELLQLDAEVPVYHLSRIQTLMFAGRLDDAVAAGRQAAAHCHGDAAAILDELLALVNQRRLAEALEPARQHYRARKYRKARKAMDETRDQWSNEPLWKIFRTYLEDLGGNLFSSGRQPSEVKPSGEFQFVDRLHFFLIREELALGKSALQEDRPDEANQVLRLGFALAPHFPYLNYLLACAALDSVTNAIREEKLDLDEIERRLDEAQAFAQLGMTDSEITSAAATSKSIEELLAAVRDALHRRAERQRQMDNIFDPLAKRFIGWMEAAKNGIDSPEKFRALQKTLRDLRGRIPPARDGVTDETVVEYMQHLADAVEHQWTQIQEIEPEVAMVEKLVEARKRLETIIEPEAQNLTSGRRDAVLQQLTALRNDVDKLRNGPAEMTELIGELIAEIEDTKILVPTLCDFSVTMKKLSRQELAGPVDLITRLRAVRTSATACKGNLKTKSAKGRVEALLTAINDFLRQLGA